MVGGGQLARMTYQAAIPFGVTLRVLAERADELVRMIRGVAETLKWFDEAPAFDIAGKLQSYFPDVPVPLFAACIDRYRALHLWGARSGDRPRGLRSPACGHALGRRPLARHSV